jgi:hypothetical protein
MNVQGLGHYPQINSMCTDPVKSKVKVSDSEEIEKQKDTSERSQSTNTDRDALLQKIKGKIENGYYNSDSVIEDLSHGFAKILDENL